MSDSSVQTFVDVICDEAAACDLVERVLEFATLGDVHAEIEIGLVLWTCETFLPREEYLRVHRAVTDAAQFLRDLARAHGTRTGESWHVPRWIIEGLQRTILSALFPSGEAICRRALGDDPALVARRLAVRQSDQQTIRPGAAARQLLDRIPEGQWRERS